ncbi:MAG: DUF1190 domain-containing protein [Hyphomicrobium sp.]|nr:DUF1190 domain-containing protein [Hyphomicrobium sp.]
MLAKLGAISGRYLVVASAAMALAGCGGAPKKDPKSIVKYVITSAIDCQESAQLSYEDCTSMIEKAVVAHDGNAPKFTTLKACEAKEGADKCERIDDRVFRPKLAAFLLTMNTPPTVEPLYVSQTGLIGFRSASAAMLSVDDEALTFSKSATHAAEVLTDTKKAAGISM